MFGGLLKKLGAWTTLKSWNEPWFFRVRLKGDVATRIGVSFGFGAFGAALLLVLFALDKCSPHPLHSLWGSLAIGGLAWLFLFRGKSTANGRIRICEEGVIRARQYMGVGVQWIEDTSWKYEDLRACAIVPNTALGNSFSVLLLATDRGLDMLGVPARLNLQELAGVLAARGLHVQASDGLPDAWRSKMSPAWGALGGVLGLVCLIFGLGMWIASHGLGRNGPGVPVAAPVPQQAQPVPGGAAGAPLDRPEQPGGVPQFQPPPQPTLPNLPPGPPGGAPNLGEFPRIGRPDLGPSGGTLPVPPPPTVPGTSTPPNPPTRTPPTVPTSPVVPMPSAGPPSTVSGAAAAAPDASRELTPVVGGAGGRPFEHVLGPDQMLVGFRFLSRKQPGKSSIAILTPLETRSAGRFNVTVAKEGYVVGGLEVVAAEEIAALRAWYVKQTPAGLDPSDAYFGDWIGDPGAATPQRIGDGTKPVVGIHGRRSTSLQAIGLILRKS